MSELIRRAFSRPEFTRDIIGTREEPFLTGGSEPFPMRIPPSVSLTQPGQSLAGGSFTGLLPEQDTRNVLTRTPMTVRGPSPALRFLADFATAFGAGVPAAQEQQKRRNLEIERPFLQAQEAATVESGLLSTGLRERRENRLLGLQEREQRSASQVRADRLALDTRAQERLESTAGKEIVALPSGQRGVADVTTGMFTPLQGVPLTGTIDIESIIPPGFTPQQKQGIRAVFGQSGYTAAIQQIDRIEDNRRLAESARTAAAIDPDDIETFADALGTGQIEQTGVPIKIRGKAIALANQKYGAIITRKQREAFLAIDQLDRLINEMEVVSEQVNTSFPGVSLVTGVGKAAARIAGAAPFTTQLKAFDATLGQLVRAIGGESGSRLSDQDIVRMRTSVPTEFDSGVAAKAKIDFLRSKAKGARQSLVASIGQSGRSLGMSSPTPTAAPSTPSPEIKQYGGYEYIRQPDGTWKRGRKL